ncbi:hypothetical protein T459_21543 [Capsicum annuum]|uniref:Uncharacterized protein n=1 Tax=Capsicum annuum TaxID=4072 RepID=A0A2G2YWZ3_CAPAN|nr:hypothetical protein T459_21543 [Capsicum annuum]
MFSGGKLKIKGKRVADVVKALIGSYLSSGGEVGTLRFMKWLGMKIYFANAPLLKLFPMNDEKVVNVKYLESLLHYKFQDPSLFVKAQTHGSYMLLGFDDAIRLFSYINVILQKCIVVLIGDVVNLNISLT